MIHAEGGNSSHAVMAEQWLRSQQTALAELALTHGDPAIALLAGESAERLNDPNSPLSLAMRDITSNRQVLDMVSREAPANGANKLVKELVAQDVYSACRSYPEVDRVDIAADRATHLFANIEEQDVRDGLFARLADANNRYAFVGGYILPTPANVPRRGIIEKVFAITEGQFSPIICDLGGSIGLVYKHQLYNLPYEDVEVGAIDNPRKGFDIDSELTRDFNYLANHRDYSPSKVAIVDLVIATRGLELVRAMVYSLYPREWLDRTYSQGQVDLIKLPIPKNLKYFEDDAADLDLQEFKGKNPEFSEGADITTAMTMMHQVPADSDKILRTMGRTTKLGGPKIVQDFGAFVPRGQETIAYSTRGKSFRAEEANWSPNSYSFWVARNHNPDASPQDDEYVRYATCTTPRVKQIEPSEEFARAIRRAAQELRRKEAAA